MLQRGQLTAAWAGNEMNLRFTLSKVPGACAFITHPVRFMTVWIYLAFQI